MKTSTIFSLSLLACLIGVGTVGTRAANAASRTLYLPFRAIVRESCYTPTSLSDISLDSQSPCSVYTETTEILRDGDETQQYAETVGNPTEPLKKIVRVTVVGN